MENWTVISPLHSRVIKIRASKSRRMVWQQFLGKTVLSKAALTGTAVAALAGRRALWPAFTVGTIFSGAAWFGTFELVWSTTKVVMPIPAKPDESARTTGLITLPITTIGTLYAGYITSPALAPVPASLTDISGLLSYVRSWPLKHYAAIGASSAAVAAVTCRIVQYRGGA